MAGELKFSNLQLPGKQDGGAATFRSSTDTFKTAGLVALSTTSGSGITPRKYIKVLHVCVTSLEKHRHKLPEEVLKAMRDLDAVVKEAAHTHSATANGKLHYYLVEDMQIQRLRAAAAELHTCVLTLLRLSTYHAPDLQADLNDVANKLHSRCVLPGHQLQLIEEFRALTSKLDPTAEIGDGMQKAAEQVVRKVIVEVHGPFFNDEILDKELTHLEKAATRLDPISQRAEAAAVKLLASTLMQLDADEQGDDDYDSLAPGSASDPFTVPSFAPVMRVVDSVTPQRGSPVKQLTIQLTGDEGSTTSSPLTTTRWHSPSSSPAHHQLSGALSALNTSTTALFTGHHTGESPTQDISSRLGPGGNRLASAATGQQAVVAAAAADEAAAGHSIACPSAADPPPPQHQQQEHRTVEAEAAAAQSRQLLDEFIASSSSLGTRDSRKACMFHAQMRLPPEGVEKLAQFIETTARVRGLSLAYNKIGPSGMQRLCSAMRSNRSIRMLELQDNKLGDAGAIALAQVLQEGNKLKELQLSANEIGDEGMVALAQAISKARYLEKLSLYNNSIGTVGCQALTAAVEANPTVKVVEFLPGNCAAPKDVKALACAVKQNRKFNICHLFKQRQPS